MLFYLEYELHCTSLAFSVAEPVYHFALFHVFFLMRAIVKHKLCTYASFLLTICIMYLGAKGFITWSILWCRCTMHCFKFCHLEMESNYWHACVHCIVLLQNVDCNLWTAKLFPVCSSRKESCAATIEIIKGVQEKSLHRILCKLYAVFHAF